MSPIFSTTCMKVNLRCKILFLIKFGLGCGPGQLKKDILFLVASPDKIIFADHSLPSPNSESLESWCVVKIVIITVLQIVSLPLKYSMTLLVTF